MLEAILSPEDRKVANAAGNSDLPRGLNNCIIGQEEIAAADGFMLVRRQLNTCRGKDIIAVPARILLMAKGAKADKRNNGDVVINRGEVKLQYRRGNIKLEQDTFNITLTPGKTTLTFERFNQLADIKNEPKATTAISTNLLAKVLKALPGNAILRLRIHEPSDPIEFSCADRHEGGITEGLIMPMHVQWDKVEWYGDRHKPQNEETKEQSEEG